MKVHAFRKESKRNSETGIRAHLDCCDVAAQDVSNYATETPTDKILNLVLEFSIKVFLGHVIPKTQKMVLDTSLLNTQQYKVRIKGKVEQSRERSSALPYTSV